MSHASRTERSPSALLARPVLRRLLELASVASGLLALLILLTGGTTLQWGSLRLRAHDATLPLALALCSGAALVLAGWWQAFVADVRLLVGHAGVAGTLATLVAGLSLSTFTAGGADSSGYLNEAALMAQGRFSVDLPLARIAPWPNAEWLFVPFGFRPGVEPGTMVPTYAPGLPLTFASVTALLGPQAAFAVVPILGACGVWLTFWLGRGVGGVGVGAMAATLLACSPIFLFQLGQPMSDVPTMVWWLAAFALAVRPTARAAVGAGALASAAVMTRPNLAPLVVIVGGFLWWNARASLPLSGRSSAGRLLAMFGAAGALGPLAVAAWQTLLYGSALRSGYGTVDELFSLTFVWPNLWRYGQWMVDAHTPLVALALCAPMVRRPIEVGSDDPREPDPTRGLAIRFSWCALAFVGAVLVAYLVYVPFDDWTFLRFLLPSLPLLFVLVAVTLARLVAWLPQSWRATVLVLCTGVLAFIYVSNARQRDVFTFRQHEQRYRAVGSYLSTRLPDDAVVVTVQHSGSAHYYTGGPVLRWDAIDSGRLDETLAWLRQQGHRPFIVLERWEEPAFRARFAAASPIGGLDWPPMAEHRTGVVVYDPAHRALFAEGRPIATERVADMDARP